MNPFFMVMKMEIPHFMAFVKPMKIPLNIIWLNSWPMKNLSCPWKFHEILRDLIDDPWKHLLWPWKSWTTPKLISWGMKFSLRPWIIHESQVMKISVRYINLQNMRQQFNFTRIHTESKHTTSLYSRNKSKGNFDLHIFCFSVFLAFQVHLITNH